MRGQLGAIFNSLSETQGEERPKGAFKNQRRLQGHLKTRRRPNLAAPFPPHFSRAHSGIFSKQDPGGRRHKEQASQQ